MTETLFWFALTELLLSLSPGPAVFLVISLSMRQGFRAGIGATFGIIGVNVLYFILSLAGIGAALAASPVAFAALKYAGAAYLGWMAFEILRDLTRETGTPLAFAGAPGASPAFWRRSVPSGVAVQASSIKNILVFLAIVPQFIDPAGNVGAQFLALCIVSVAVELPVLLAYAWLANSLADRAQSGPVRSLIEAGSAVALAGIAVFVLAVPPQ